MSPSTKPIPSLLKSVIFPSIATSSLTGFSLSSFWSGVDATELASSLSAASSATLTGVSSLANADEARVQEARVRAVQKIRLATMAVPAAAVGTGTFVGCALARCLFDRFGFIRKYRLLRMPVPLFLGTAGTLCGGFVGIHCTIAAVISVGNKAVLGVILGELGAPDWLANLLIS